MIKTCKICGKEFNARNPNTRYCGGICRLENQNRYRKAYVEKNKDKIQAYKTAYSFKYG